MLDGRKEQYVNLKIEHPEFSPQKIAEIIGVSRQAIWEWSKQAEVKAELDRRLQAINHRANLRLRSRSDELMQSLLDLATNPKTEARVRSSALQYLLDRSMGKAAEQVNVDLTDNTTDAADVLQGFKDFLKTNGYYKEDSNNERT